MSAPGPDVPHEPGQTCNAKTRQGGRCKQRAGARTDHPLEGRCWLHGGATPIRKDGSRSKLKSRYDLITRPRIRELLDAFADDPDPLNLLPELSLLRALVLDFIERYDGITEALLRWNRTFDREYQATLADARDNGWDELLHGPIDPLATAPSKPDKIIDILSVGAYLAQIGSMTEKIRKARETQTFSMATIDRLWEAMSAHLQQGTQEVINDAALRETLLDAVGDRWRTINLAALASGRPAPGEVTD